MIILSSNGINNNGMKYESTQKLFGEIIPNKNVLVISNASWEESNPDGKFQVYENLKKFSPKNLEMLKIDKDNVSKILKFEVIYIVGGDTKQLLPLQEIGIVEHLRAFLSGGNILLGESAGSLCLAKDTRYYYEINKDNPRKKYIMPASTKGFGLVENNVVPHVNAQTEEYIKRCKEVEAELGIELTYLCDGDYLFIK